MPWAWPMRRLGNHSITPRPPPPHARFCPSDPRLFRRRRPPSPSPAYAAVSAAPPSPTDAAPDPPLLHHRAPPRIRSSSISERRPLPRPPTPAIRPSAQSTCWLRCGERGEGGCRRRPYFANGG
ncbi:hypothetical protein BS78_06G214700 [Paspalum vaginatum]|nr:hypothetical protein BS78_06G214700 [Paspalum vaginatum]